LAIRRLAEDCELEDTRAIDDAEGNGMVAHALRRQARNGLPHAVGILLRPRFPHYPRDRLKGASGAIHRINHAHPSLEPPTTEVTSMRGGSIK
jgi:hypothetical protein